MLLVHALLQQSLYLPSTIFKYRNLLYFVTAHYAFHKKKSRLWQFYNVPPLKVRSSARV